MMLMAMLISMIIEYLLIFPKRRIKIDKFKSIDFILFIC